MKKQKPTSKGSVVASVRLDAGILKIARHLKINLSDVFNRKLLMEVAQLHTHCPTCGTKKGNK